jgi:hypothetical protein
MVETMRKEITMSSRKSFVAALVLAVIVGVVPRVQAQNLEVVIAGSSALFNSLALGAYNGGTSIVSGGGQTFHWTSASNAVNLTDSRPTPVNNDAGTVWVVWDSAATPNVWIFDKVDSVVGNRCYFAQPHCSVNASAATVAAAGAGQVSSSLWGADTNLPASIQALFTAGTTLVSVAATDIRPEDAAFVICRVNSALGAGTAGGTASDKLDGLGYNTKNASGVCPAYPIGTTGKGLGSPVLSGYPGSTGAANVLAFNISGKDPFTGTVIPTYTVIPVGAAPIVFIIERDKGQLTNLQNATEHELQEVFSGTDCDASAFGLPAGAISINLREPLSGTMNTTEASVFRRPTVYPGAILGVSQEANVNGPVNNPLKGQAAACLAGLGARYRAIGTSEEVKSVQESGANYGHDGIGYTFFSYGNVSSIANNTAYGYITLNGIDPIFQTYGSTLDPGQPATDGTLPGAANLPATCAGGAGSFPCSEHDIWKNGFSFPNLRNGTYRAWSSLRLIATGTAGPNATALVKASNVYVVNDIPDYVPLGPVTGTTDLGLKLVHSHYQQLSGSGALLGSTPVNSPEKGGDMGGFIIPTLIGATTAAQTQLVQNANSTNTNLGPALRP